MTTKFVQQKGRYFFLSNSISVYSRPGAEPTQRIVASEAATPLTQGLAARLFSQQVTKSSQTQYFLNNSNGSNAPRIFASAGPTTAFGWNWTRAFTKLKINPISQRSLNAPPEQLSAVKLQQLLSRPPGFMDTLKASFFPASLRSLQRQRPSFDAAKATYATFRDLGYQGRAGGSGGSGRNNSAFNYLKIPILFTIGVCAFNAIALPYLFQVPGFDYLKKNPKYIVYGLIGANALVFFAWKSPKGFGRQLYRYGLLHKDAQFNKWQMIGSAFSHQEFWHLAINMFVLYQFGGSIIQWVGAKNFLEMYLDSAAISSLGSISFPFLLNKFTRLVVLSSVPSLGASGAIFSIFGAFSYLVPYAKLSLFFIPLPIGAWYVFLLTMGYNGLGMGFNWGRTDYAGHFAGCAAGILFGYIFAEKAKRAREQRRIQSYRVF